jgi:hypothetical protein
MVSTCYLCAEEKELGLSHILPAFSHNWLRNNAVGSVRGGETPNKRIQDGYKIPLLCGDCEQKLGVWEKAFAERVFSLHHRGEIDSFSYPYETWALKFAVSVSWRILTLFMIQNKLNDLSVEQTQHINKAENVWRSFLRGEQEHPGIYEQHIIFLETLENHNDPNLSPYFNRYLVSTNDMDVYYDSQHVLVYAKMGKIFLFGFIHPPLAKKWENTKIQLKRGIMKNSRYKLPLDVMSYINERANQTARLFPEMSPKQYTKVQETNLDKFAQSSVFKAMQKDIEFFGDRAFEITEPQERASNEK